MKGKYVGAKMKLANLKELKLGDGISHPHLNAGFTRLERKKKRERSREKRERAWKSRWKRKVKMKKTLVKSTPISYK